MQYHGKRWCVKCKDFMDHTCFHMSYRKSETNDDAYTKTERWNCDKCHTDKVIVKEIPIPTEKGMLVKLLMSLNERYELAGTTISVGFHEVRATFKFAEHDMPKLRERKNATLAAVLSFLLAGLGHFYVLKVWARFRSLMCGGREVCY